MGFFSTPDLARGVSSGLLDLTEYRTVFEASPDGILVVGADGTVRDVNPRVEDLFGYAREELLGEPVEMLVPGSLRHAHQGHRAAFSRAPRTRPMGIDLELRALRKDGSEIPVEISLSPVAGNRAFTICTVRDVTDRKRLRDFSKASLRSVEEERQRIARELHDDTAQRLATLILRVRLLAYVTDPDERTEELAELREQLREAAEGVKRIARGLRPPALDEVGLTTALEAHLRDLREGANFDVHAEVEGVDHVLEEGAQLALYRIVQESLSNVMRHAGVSRAYLRIGIEDGRVVELVEDAGRGFVASRAGDHGGGLGLLGMHERAVMTGGRVTVRSAPGEGTRVRVELPLSVKEMGHV